MQWFFLHLCIVWIVKGAWHASSLSLECFDLWLSLCCVPSQSRVLRACRIVYLAWKTNLLCQWCDDWLYSTLVTWLMCILGEHVLATFIGYCTFNNLPNYLKQLPYHTFTLVLYPHNLVFFISVYKNILTGADSYFTNHVVPTELCIEKKVRNMLHNFKTLCYPIQCMRICKIS